jgi:7-carboxy-7-deazaguanine synthase
VETNGAIALAPFHLLRESDPVLSSKVRFVMDYKLPASGEMERMIHANFDALEPGDEGRNKIRNRK